MKVFHTSFTEQKAKHEEHAISSSCWEPGSRNKTVNDTIGYFYVYGTELYSLGNVMWPYTHQTPMCLVTKGFCLLGESGT
ncbi:unnamed protein product [Prunus armeniaca]|uniref:Uncharacterized protein n=2 Tax=Prunus armeniaca TaxID=36596 RepID=A0A6J5WW84_PRUAR|nr:unnamed protein product [Prunus armeniaca]